MESGAFSQGDLGGEDDPFAGSEEDFGLGAAEPADAAPPIVNREGEPVEATQGASDETQVAPEQAAAGSGSSAFAGASSETTDDGSPAGINPEPAEAMPSPRDAAVAAEPEGPTSASSEAPGAEGGDASADAATAGASEAEIPDAAPRESEPEAEAEVAEPPEEKKGGTKRQYKLFTPDGNGKFSEVSWAEKNGKVVERGTPGSKKQTVVLARGQEDALRHGFAVLGCPKAGASLVAVAATYFQVKHVQPDEVQPVRQRLRIS